LLLGKYWMNAPLKIFLVDDQPLTEHLMSRMLEAPNGEGLELHYTQNPLQAEANILAVKPDVILLDLAMPDMDGLELLVRLRKRAETRQIPIIMLSANEDPEQKAQAFSSGANDYMVKLPAQVEMLARLRYHGNAYLAFMRSEMHKQTQAVTTRLFQQSLDELSLEELLEEALFLILSIPWIPLEFMGSIFLVDNQGNLIMKTEQNLPEVSRSNCQLVLAGHCACGEVALSKKVRFFNCQDHQQDCIKESENSCGQAIFPILSGDDLLGVLNLYIQSDYKHNHDFDAFFRVITNTLAGIIIRHQQEEMIRVRNSKLLYERGVIEEIIVRMRASKRFDQTNLRFLLAPVENTAGDLILSAFRPDGAQHVLLGDFTGHGLPAAIGGPIVSDIFYTMTKKGLSLTEILAEMNLQLYTKTPVDIFLAAGFMELDPARRKLKIWNCGIPPILLYRDEKIDKKIETTHFARGMLELSDDPGSEIEIKSGDRIIAYTDGFVEEVNIHDQMFGEDRFERCLTEIISQGKSLEVICEILDEYRVSAEQTDDMSMVEVTC
jgi:two-component system, HptB-dependent secretion and biofilm response regulator